MTTAAIYTRISSDREGAGLGVKAQESDCRALATRLGATETIIYQDNDTSAYSGKPRPGYQLMLNDLRTGKVDMVISWHTDRLHRSPTELEEYIHVTDTIPTHTVKAGPLDLSTPSGRLVARQLGAVARYEVEHMIERQKRAKLRNAESGRWKGGRRPFGYEADGITVNDVEGQALAEATDQLLAGASLRSIARNWNEAGILTTTGKTWTMVEVRRVLMRPRNAGLMEHLGQVMGKAQWPAVVDEIKWSSAISLLTDPARKTTPGPRRKWLLSGLVACPKCGQKVICGRVNGIQAYRCRRGCVTKGQVEADALINAKMEEILPTMEISAPDIDLTHERARARAIRERLNALASLFGQGVIDAQQLTAGTKDLKVELDQITAKITNSMSPTLLRTGDIYTSWTQATLEDKRMILDALFTIRFKQSGRGRPQGWKKGQTYFRPEDVVIEPKPLGRLAEATVTIREQLSQAFVPSGLG